MDHDHNLELDMADILRHVEIIDRRVLELAIERAKNELLNKRLMEALEAQPEK